MTDLSLVQTAFADPLQIGHIRFFIKRMPKLSFAVQSANLPSIALTAAEMPSPFVRMPFAGEHIDYGDLRLTYLIDEQLANFTEIHNWMRALGKPTTFDEYAAVVMEPGTGVASDCILSILDAKRQPKATITYTNAVPVGLSDISWDSRLKDVQYASITATFRYDEFEITLL